MKKQRRKGPAGDPDRPKRQTDGGEPPELPDDPTVAPGAISIDDTGISSKGIQVDSDITEGHPGYQESDKEGCGNASP